VNLTEVRQAIADAIGSLDENLTVDLHTPSTPNPPHAWVRVDRITPDSFSRSYLVSGAVTVIVSASTDEQAEEQLDVWLSDHLLGDAFDDIDVAVARWEVTDVGTEYSVAGQGFVGFTVEFDALA